MLIRESCTRAELKVIELGLTPEEAEELVQTIAILLDAKDPGRHEHVSSADYQTELTVWVEFG